MTAYDFQVEYGVVKFDRDMLVGFEEKPVFAGFINAGIYALQPQRAQTNTGPYAF